MRWIGPRQVERFIERLHARRARRTPAALVTYVNYPTTEYLELAGVRPLSLQRLPRERRTGSSAYLARLQNLAGDRPLLMTELGLDSRATATTRQAEVLDWQIRTAFASGCAGAFVFSWTDEWHVSYLSATARATTASRCATGTSA